MWKLPPLDLPFPNTQEKYRYFARFLLEGAVNDILMHC
jgi:hypothetical protein